MPVLKRDRAVVIGAGMGGLLSARALCDDFRQVTILERDTLPAPGEHRRGVPQGRHTHFLLSAGREAIESLFPGVTERLIAAGAVPADLVRDARRFYHGGYLARCASGLEAILLSRPLLESAIRAEVAALPNVEIRPGSDAERLAATPDKRRVIGVRVCGQIVPADLVVDTTGRGCHSSAWLQALGYAAPDEERVEVGLAYTSRLFRRNLRHLDGDLAALIPPTPSGKRGGIILAQECGRWIVTLITHFRPAAPGELPGFVEFARTLPDPCIYDVVRDAEPVGDPSTTHFPASIRRRYERLTHFPEGYLVLGDAVCSFNPIYGQGMSVAALHAAELRRAMRSASDVLSRAFFERIARLTDAPWSIAVSNDLRMPETVGPRTTRTKFANWYTAKFLRAAQRDPALAVAFHRVANLTAQPASLLGPANVARVIRAGLRARREAARETPVPAPPASGRSVARLTR